MISTPSGKQSLQVKVILIICNVYQIKYEFHRRIDATLSDLVAGFFYHTAKLQKNGSYMSIKNPQTVHIHPSSGLSEVQDTIFCVFLLYATFL